MKPEEAEQKRIVREWQKVGTRPDELKPGQCVVDSEDADFAWVREGQEPPKRIRLFVRICCAEATAVERERCAKIAEDAWNQASESVNMKAHAVGIATAIRNRKQI